MKRHIYISQTLVILLLFGGINLVQTASAQSQGMVEVGMKGHTLYCDTTYHSKKFYYNNDRRIQKYIHACGWWQEEERKRILHEQAPECLHSWIYADICKDTTTFYNAVAEMFNEEELECIFTAQRIYSLTLDVYINLDGRITNAGLAIDSTLYVQCLNRDNEKIYAILNNVVECNADFSYYLQNVKEYGYTKSVDKYRNKGSYLFTYWLARPLYWRYLFYKQNGKIN